MARDGANKDAMRNIDEWSPLHLKITLHYFVSPEPFETRNPSAACSHCNDLVECGLIERIEANPYGAVYQITERGKAFVEMLKRTPLPVNRWMDPRFIQE